MPAIDLPFFRQEHSLHPGLPFAPTMVVQTPMGILNPPLHVGMNTNLPHIKAQGAGILTLGIGYKEKYFL